MKKNKIVILGCLVAVFMLMLGCTPAPQMGAEEPTAETEGEGRVVFAITDAAAEMGTVTSIMVAVDSVRVHSATEGWITVSSEPKVYDLLKLKAESSSELLADVNLEEGTYQQVRLDISSVIVVDDKGEHEAKLPSGELKIIGDLEVKANSTSTATFDFIADESLHLTGNGEYILAPVVQLETKTDAEVEVKANQKVEVKAGNVKTKIKVGMDAEGKVGVGLGIPAQAKLSIGQGRVKVDGEVGIGLGKDKGEESDNASAEVKVKVGASY